MDIYPWLKPLHIAASMIWIGGMLASAIALVACCASGGQADSRERVAALDIMRQWDRRVTSPAIVLVWVLGLTLAMQGGWFGALWLTIKLMLVLVLLVLHGMLSGTLRRLARADRPSVPASLRHAPTLTIVGVVAIIILVVFKPL